MSDLHNNPIDCAEDDYSRSNYVRSLVQNPGPLKASSLGSKSTIPKVIVQFWDNPDRVPEDVGRCLDSWNPLVAKGFDRLLFDDQSARSFISNHFGRVNVNGGPVPKERNSPEEAATTILFNKPFTTRQLFTLTVKARSGITVTITQERTLTNQLHGAPPIAGGVRGYTFSMEAPTIRLGN